MPNGTWLTRPRALARSAIRGTPQIIKTAVNSVIPPAIVHAALSGPLDLNLPTATSAQAMVITRMPESARAAGTASGYRECAPLVKTAATKMRLNASPTHKNLPTVLTTIE